VPKALGGLSNPERFVVSHMGYILILHVVLTVKNEVKMDHYVAK